METMDELKKRLNLFSISQSNDMQVVEVKEGYAKVEMIIDEQILNVHGFVHGGALFLADTAAGAASFTRVGTALPCPVRSIISSREEAAS
ncbi:MAG: PaaI family thioesterase [Clostridium sp.]